MTKRGVHEKRSEKAAHAIVASDWLKQEQNYNLFPQTLWAGNVNIGPMAIRAVFKPYSQHGFTPQNADDDDQRKTTSQGKGGTVQFCSLCINYRQLGLGRILGASRMLLPLKQRKHSKIVWLGLADTKSA